MNGPSPEDAAPPSPTDAENWLNPEPDREAVAGVVGREVLLAAIVIAIVIALWTFTAGPKMVNSGTDVTTPLPGAIAEQQGRAQLTP